MWQLIAGLVFAGVVSAVAWTAWDRFTGSYVEQGKIEQRAEDQKVVDAAEARATRAEAQALAAAQSAKVQSEALAMAQQEADRAQRQAAEVSDAYGKVVRSSEARIQSLRDLAAAAPAGNRSCEQVLSEADRILRDSARVRGAR